MFKVPVIPPDLRHEETIIQAAYALDCLQKTIATIFGRIDERIEKNNFKVKELQERISKSQEKINSLQGTRKAIRIYAPAKFPASSTFRDPPVTFNDEDQLFTKRLVKYQVESRLDTNLPSPNEKLIFFHVRDQNSEKSKAENSLASQRHNIKTNQDLGNLPSDLRSVSAVLLFNTDLSVYNLEDSANEQQSETWRRAKLKNKRHQGNNQQVIAKHILEPAPHSLVHRRNEMLTPSGGLKYTPRLSEAPELNLPLDLPDLPGIADDLRYDSPEAKQKIAPSLACIVENLPELTELLKDSDKNSGNDKEKDFASTTPAPPPPPPIPFKQSPVPPPPPPPPAREFQAASQIHNEATTTRTLQSSDDSRSELMAAIRNAGGVGKARLRPTAAAPLTSNDNDVVDNTNIHVSSTKTPGTARGPKGGDLMADLHNKLLMRRKGISGTKEIKDITSNVKDNENCEALATPTGNPVISRLSALIPPPPSSAIKHKTRNTASTSDEEEDSNDTDWVD